MTTTTRTETRPLPCDPMEMDWRWRLDSFHMERADETATARVTLSDSSDGEARRAEGRGETPLHAIIDAIFRATGYVMTLKSAKIYLTGGKGPKAQAHLVLTNEAGKHSAGFAWAESEQEAFVLAALRVVNGWEAAIATDAYCAHAMPHHFRWPRGDSARAAA